MKLALLQLQILLHYYRNHEHFNKRNDSGIAHAHTELANFSLIEFKEDINQWWLTQKGADHVSLLLQIPVIKED